MRKLLVLLALALPATATPVTWYLHDVTFLQTFGNNIIRGSAEGFFTFDVDTGQLTNWLIDTPEAWRYEPTNGTAGAAGSGSITQLRFRSSGFFLQTRNLFLVLDGPLTNARTTVTLDTAPGPDRSRETARWLTSSITFPIATGFLSTEPTGIVVSEPATIALMSAGLLWCSRSRYCRRRLSTEDTGRQL